MVRFSVVVCFNKNGEENIPQALLARARRTHILKAFTLLGLITLGTTYRQYTGGNNRFWHLEATETNCKHNRDIITF